ncbi:hypothetical protein HMPREF3190_00506 [Umbribacter vaginalis]|nr:hypothetical protein HMPREF3190_00506 [Coriobacteriales bacterium DNF00809]
MNELNNVYVQCKNVANTYHANIEPKNKAPHAMCGALSLYPHSNVTQVTL